MSWMGNSAGLGQSTKFTGAIDGPELEDWIQEVEAASASRHLPDLLAALWHASGGTARIALEQCGQPITLPADKKAILAHARVSSDKKDTEAAVKLLQERASAAVSALRKQFSGERYYNETRKALAAYEYDQLNPEQTTRLERVDSCCRQTLRD